MAWMAEISNRSTNLDPTNASAATGRRVHFAPSTTVKEVSRHGGHLRQFGRMVARSNHLATLELNHFPSEKSWKEWLYCSDGTTIAGGEHKGRPGYIMNYLERDNKCLLVRLASPNPELHLHEIALVERQHFESGAAGSLPPTVSGMKRRLCQSECVSDDGQPNPKRRRRMDATDTFTFTQSNQAPTNDAEDGIVDMDWSPLYVDDKEEGAKDGIVDMDWSPLYVNDKEEGAKDGIVDMDWSPLYVDDKEEGAEDGIVDMDWSPLYVNDKEEGAKDGIVDMDWSPLYVNDKEEGAEDGIVDMDWSPLYVNDKEEGAEDGIVDMDWMVTPESASDGSHLTTKRRRTDATDPFTFTQSNQAPTNVTEPEDMEYDLTPDDHEEEEEEAGNHTPVSTTGTKKRRLCQSESVCDDGQPNLKRPRKDNDAAPSHSPFTDDDGGSWDQDDDDDDDDDAGAATDDEADTSRLGSYTITGGKYAGKQCIIVKHLARKVRVELVDSGKVTCISRRSLGLDEEKTAWHEEPRRSPRGHEQPRRSARIKAMMEASKSYVV